MLVSWYFTDLDFLPFETLINPLDLDEQPWRHRRVGEQYGYARPYNGRLIMPGLNGEHQCGPAEYWERGQPWPYTGLPVQYDEDWIPLCCGRNIVANVCSGARPHAIFIHTYLSKLTSGARPAALLKRLVHAEAEIASGARPDSSAVVIGHREARIASGSAPEALIRHIQRAQAEIASGSMPEALLLSGFHLASEIASGSMPEALVEIRTPEPSNVASGSAPEALVAIIPGTSPPGATCAAAGSLAVGPTGYTGPLTPGADWWWIISVTNGVQYHMDVTGTIPAFCDFTAYSGLCSLLSPLFVTASAPGCRSWTSGYTGTAYVRLHSLFAGPPQTPTVIVDTGPC